MLFNNGVYVCMYVYVCLYVMTVFKFELGELTDCDAVGVLAQVSRLRYSGSACSSESACECW